MKCFEHCILAIRKYLQCCNATTQETDHFIEFIVPWENKNNNNHRLAICGRTIMPVIHCAQDLGCLRRLLPRRIAVSSTATANRQTTPRTSYTSLSPLLHHPAPTTCTHVGSRSWCWTLFTDTRKRGGWKMRDRVRKGIRVFYNIAQWEIWCYFLCKFLNGHYNGMPEYKWFDSGSACHECRLA